MAMKGYIRRNLPPRIFTEDEEDSFNNNIATKSQKKSEQSSLSNNTNSSNQEFLENSIKEEVRSSKPTLDNL